MNDLFIFKLCSDGAAYEVKSKKKIKLELTSVSEDLAIQLKMKIRVNLPVILILEDDTGRSITIYPTGRLLLRKFTSEESALEAARLLSPILYSPANTGS
ncbi:MAG: hypothetical protein ACXAAO_09275 [Candidatus Thorarchaeota archaeon]|jgi:hypothetical protein